MMNNNYNFTSNGDEQYFSTTITQDSFAYNDISNDENNMLGDISPYQNAIERYMLLTPQSDRDEPSLSSDVTPHSPYENNDDFLFQSCLFDLLDNEPSPTKNETDYYPPAVYESCENNNSPHQQFNEGNIHEQNTCDPSQPNSTVTYTVINNNDGSYINDEPLEASNDADEDFVVEEEDYKEEREKKSRKREATSYNNMQLFGESEQCYKCKSIFDKNFLFNHCSNQARQRNRYICLKCTLGIPNISIRQLKDWEETPTYNTKKCYRCNCKRSMRRFKDKKRLCAYCTLKKKFVYQLNCLTKVSKK